MKGLLSLFAFLVALPLFAGRTVISLSGPRWTCDGVSVSVPHTWNAADGADGDPLGIGTNALDRYGMSISPDTYVRKAATYRRALPDPTPGRRQFIRFGAVSREATVRINGHLAGTHAGAFTAFTLEATRLLAPSNNILEVVADNRWNPDLAPLSADYTLQGGIYRDVEWIETPLFCIDPVTDGASGVALDINTNGTVVATVRLLGAAPSPAHAVEKRTFLFPHPKLWSPESPNLYTAKVEIASGDCVEVPFGFRTVEFRKDGFYLNGVKRKLRGVNRHQDAGPCGWAALAEDDARDFALIKEMGADAVRLTHYPQSRRVLELCDRLGLLVWCEEPAINWLSSSAAFRANLLAQAREMVAQNRNHPCIFAWSLFNEIYNAIPPERDREGWMEEELRAAKAELKALDATRPVVAATDRPTRRPLNDLPDELAFNAYPGWYGDTTIEEDVATWFRASARPLLAISEYGAGGNPRDHLDTLPSGRLDPGGPFHPEEVQTLLHVADYRAIQAENRLWGSFVWAMFDFAADARREGGVPGINDKGLVTRDRTIRKDAYFFYKANWSGEGVLHLCSARARETTNAVTRVVGFSNVGPVTLVVNGAILSTKVPDGVKTVVWPAVALRPGENEIRLEAGGRASRRRVFLRPASSTGIGPATPCGDVRQSACLP